MKGLSRFLARSFSVIMVLLILLTFASPVFAQAADPPAAQASLDLSQFIKVSVAGIPILFLIIGIVGIFKMLGVKDRWLTLASIVNGLFWGTGYQISQVRPPDIPDWWVAFVYWFAVLAYGVALAIVASLFYDAFKNTIDTLIQRAVSSLLGNPTQLIKSVQNGADVDQVVETLRKSL